MNLSLLETKIDIKNKWKKNDKNFTSRIVFVKKPSP